MSTTIGRSPGYATEDAYIRAFNARLEELSLRHHGVPAAHLQYTAQHALSAIVYGELGSRRPGGTTYSWQDS